MIVWIFGETRGSEGKGVFIEGSLEDLLTVLGEAWEGYATLDIGGGEWDEDLEFGGEAKGDD